MANKGFGAREINLIGVAGTPAIDSAENLILGANTVFVEGDIKATRFYGDGSQLTGITASGGTGDSYWIAASAGSMAGIGTLGPVAIGTSPNFVQSNTALTIEGNVAIRSDRRSLNFISNTVNVDADIGIRFYEGTSDLQPRMSIDYNGSDQIPATGQIEIRGVNNDIGGAYFTYVAINRYGHVGIGSTRPRHAIDVIGNANIVGVVTANKFVGDGSGLAGVVGSGSGVVIKNDNNLIGTAGTINFTNNLRVSPISLGIVTVTIEGASNWARTTAGIHTLSNVGIGTTNPTCTLTVSGLTSTTQFYVSGVSTFRSPVYEGVTNNFNTTLAPSGGTLTITPSNGTIILGTLNAPVTTWAFTGIDISSGKSTTLTLIIDSTSTYTYGDACTVNGNSITGGIRWASGLPPVATSNEDILSFTIITDNAGTTRVYATSVLNII